MDSQLSSLNWSYLYQGKSMDELRYSLLYTTLELETTRLEAQEEIKRKEDQLNHLKELLHRIIKERDEAQDKCETLLMEKLFLLHQPPQQTTPLSGLSSIDDETRRGDSNNGISSSDCEESIVSSPVIDPIMPPPPPSVAAALTPTILQLTAEIPLPEKPLPEKGKFLQAVMKAGPLLQTLLLAGPLPQWRHPPPLLESIEIPPVTIPSPPLLPYPLQPGSYTINISPNHNSNGVSFNQKKRALPAYEESDSSTNTKYQRMALH